MQGSRWAYLPRLLFAILLLSPMTVYCQSSGLFETQDSSGASLYCAEQSDGWIPGIIWNDGEFLSYKIYKRFLRRKLRNSKAKRRAKRIKKKFRLIKRRSKEGGVICEAGPPSQDPDPDSTPVPGTTPMPTPTQPGLCFDAGGNTTSFEIPSGYTGNSTRGSQVWFGTCRGCHLSEHIGLNYAQLVNQIASEPSMQRLPERLSTQDFSDVIAYLNRFTQICE